MHWFNKRYYYSIPFNRGPPFYKFTLLLQKGWSCQNRTTVLLFFKLNVLKTNLEISTTVCYNGDIWTFVCSEFFPLRQMITNCELDLFQYLYEGLFIRGRLKDNRKIVARSFAYIRYINEAISLNIYQLTLASYISRWTWHKTNKHEIIGRNSWIGHNGQLIDI